MATSKRKDTNSSEKELEEPVKVYVDLATSEEDVVAYDQAGAHLVFNRKRFRTLSTDSLNALSHDNRKRYLETRKAIEEEREAMRPPPRPQIIDPLGRHEGALINVRVTDPQWEKRWHVCWKYCDEVESLSRYGYTPVRVGEDPVESGLKPAGSTFVIKDARNRSDLDIILMKVAMTSFLQHQTAVAASSTDKIKGYRDKFADDVAESSKGRLKGQMYEEPTEEVSLKRSDLRPVS